MWSSILILGLILQVAEGQEEAAPAEAAPAEAQVGTSPAPEAGGGGSLCDQSKWGEYQNIRQNAESPSNAELIQEAYINCREQLTELAQGMFGPPRYWDIFNVACKNQCEQWDSLVRGGLAVSRCSYSELKIVDQSSAFWQCKILYICYENEDGVRDPVSQNENFCKGCGSGQVTEERYYEELDCGAGMSKTRINASILLLTTFVMLVLML